ncbi:TPA: beta strand repeat-containing protein, partial [Serratia fonticola]
MGYASNANTESGAAGYSPTNATTGFKNAVNATVSTHGAVAVGDSSAGVRRQITGVAAGTTDTDAVNVAQLKALESTPMIFAGNSGSVAKVLGNTLSIQGAGTTADTYSGKNLKTTVDGNGVLQLQMADNPVVNSVIATDGTDTSSLTANGLMVTGGPSVTTSGINAAGKKVTNVAAGDVNASSTDAVNGSQLQKTEDKVATNTANIATNTSNIANNTTNINALQNDALQWDATLNAYNANHMGNGSSKITKVANGDVNADSTDAVNGSQLFQIAGDTSNTYIAKNGAGVKYVRTNDSGLAGSDAFAQGPGSTAVGYNASTDIAAINGLALGNGATVSANGGVALGAGSVADGSTLSNQAYLVGGTAQSEVNVGDRRITGLSAGAEATDAVNVAQLKAVTANSVADAVMYDNSTRNNITLKGDNYDNSTHTGGTTITNVADGQAPSDAVNYSQLSETNQLVSNNTTSIANNAAAITNLGNTVTNINDEGTKYFHAKSTGTDSEASGVDAIAIGMGAVADVARSIALGDGAKTATAVGTTGATIGDQDYVFAGTAPVGTLSIGDVSAERT